MLNNKSIFFILIILGLVFYLSYKNNLVEGLRFSPNPNVSLNCADLSDKPFPEWAIPKAENVIGSNLALFKLNNRNYQKTSKNDILVKISVSGGMKRLNKTLYVFKDQTIEIVDEINNKILFGKLTITGIQLINNILVSDERLTKLNNISSWIEPDMMNIRIDYNGKNFMVILSRTDDKSGKSKRLSSLLSSNRSKNDPNLDKSLNNLQRLFTLLCNQVIKT